MSRARPRHRRGPAPWLLALCLAGGATADALAAGSCGPPREPGDRPRIGLALAGGGGKGWAHVGVLKVLEALRVPVDCIAGTSAGAIVGGVYATGTGPDEMEAILHESDWNVLFRDSAPREDQSFARKSEDLRGLWNFEVGVDRHGVKVPTGIFAGQEVNALLRRMTRRAAGASSFDSLRIPFRAVATDLRTGELVVLDHGELAAAMRASMAVPGAFTPETVDGRLLVDGGVRENLPVQTVRAMGADIVIAVDLGSAALSDDRLGNPLGVAQQAVAILLDLNVRASRATLTPSDVLIQPQVAGFSTGDFSRGRELVPIGERAARQVEGRLRTLALSEADYRLWQEARRQRGRDRVPVAEVVVDASQLRHVNPDYVRSQVSGDRGTRTVEPRHVEDEIADLLGDGHYERIDYRYADRPDGRRALVVTPREKPWGPGYLGLGLQLATDFRETTWFNLLGSYRRTWVNALGAEWRNDFSVGQTTAVRSEFHQPLSLSGGFFVAPAVFAGRTSQNLFVADQPVATYRIQTLGVGLDAGRAFGRYAELRIGLERADIRYEPSVALPLFPVANYAAGSVVTRFTVDRLDSASFPRAGYLLAAIHRLSEPALGADVRYQKATLAATGAYSLGPHTLQLEVKGGGAIDGQLPIHDLQSLGGLFNLSGYMIRQYQGQRSVLGRSAYYYRMADVPVVLKGLYTGVSLETGQVWRRIDGSPGQGLLPAAAIFVGADSALGPFYLAYGRGLDDGIQTLYFYLGTSY